MSVTRVPRIWWMVALLSAIGLTAEMPAGAGQLPPSITSSRVRGSTRLLPDTLDPETRQARCADLKALVAALKPDADTPAKRREVADYDRMRVALACPDTVGALAGTWRITGNPQSSGEAPVAGTVVLTVMQTEAALKLADEPNWGMASSRICRNASTSMFFYSGTVVWDRDTLLNNARSMWDNAGPSTILLCAAAPDSTQAKGNVRDNRGAYGATIQWDGLSSGQIFPDTNQGRPQSFTATKSK